MLMAGDTIFAMVGAESQRRGALNINNETL
jgi:hypothetical protein